MKIFLGIIYIISGCIVAYDAIAKHLQAKAVLDFIIYKSKAFLEYVINSPKPSKTFSIKCYISAFIIFAESYYFSLQHTILTAVLSLFLLLLCLLLFMLPSILKLKNFSYKQILINAFYEAKMIFGGKFIYILILQAFAFLYLLMIHFILKYRQLFQIFQKMIK